MRWWESRFTFDWYKQLQHESGLSGRSLFKSVRMDESGELVREEFYLVFHNFLLYFPLYNDITSKHGK